MNGTAISGAQWPRLQESPTPTLPLYSEEWGGAPQTACPLQGPPPTTLCCRSRPPPRCSSDRLPPHVTPSYHPLSTHLTAPLLQESPTPTLPLYSEEWVEEVLSRVFAIITNLDSPEHRGEARLCI